MPTLYPSHQVADIVYLHDSETDSLIRCRVLSIQAQCGERSQHEWDVTYTVASFNASLPRNWTVEADRLHKRPDYAFPPLPPVVEPESADEAVAA